MLKWHLMKRREFIKRVGLGLAAGWAGGGLAWPRRAWAAAPELRLALLADAHLKDGDDRRPEAMALARAVAEIRALTPPPDLVGFAGDLARILLFFTRLAAGATRLHNVHRCGDLDGGNVLTRAEPLAD